MRQRAGTDPHMAQPTQLEDAPLRRALNTAITEYFTINEGTVSTKVVERDTFKVVIRGVGIKTMEEAWSQILHELIAIEERLNKVERETITDPRRSPELLAARKRHVEFVEQLGVYDYRTYTHWMHTDGDRAVALLAHIIKLPRTSVPVLQVLSQAGRMSSTQLEVNKTFQEY
ncbi:hypothetical protein NDU88_000324 [Pleurodeles waltl]|uniref:Uncharacterized protein n=1 Tax=Pleurodeles waltl TaxID=8319 RepID=A0AAV7VT56_PLEWA|nr:hypothetical protein NDU88_000324 [Pleurodeles waltl]